MQIGILGLLGIVFVVLKLINVIDWSWWWVTCPFWISIALYILFYIFLKLVVVPLLILYNKAVHREEYEYMKKLHEYMNKREKSSTLLWIEAQRDKAKKNKEQI